MYIATHQNTFQSIKCPLSLNRTSSLTKMTCKPAFVPGCSTDKTIAHILTTHTFMYKHLRALTDLVQASLYILLTCRGKSKRCPLWAFFQGPTEDSPWPEHVTGARVSQNQKDSPVVWGMERVRMASLTAHGEERNRSCGVHSLKWPHGTPSR